MRPPQKTRQHQLCRATRTEYPAHTPTAPLGAIRAGFFLQNATVERSLTRMAELKHLAPGAPVAERRHLMIIPCPRLNGFELSLAGSDSRNW
jgi:hypothetical protein